MADTKKILLLKADGKTEQLIQSKPPTWAQIKNLINADTVERVRVLDHITASGRFVYTSMFVHEEGLLIGLPRNEKATELYQRNCRERFKDAANPFLAALEEMTSQAEARGMAIITPPEPTPGYSADPYIAGDALFFQGYTCEEVDGFFA